MPTVDPCPRCGERADEGGWCACCGQDLRPGVPDRFSRAAAERSARWAADPEAARAQLRRRQADLPPAASPAPAPVVPPGARRAAPAAGDEPPGPGAWSDPRPSPPVTVATAPRISELAIAAFVLACTGAAILALPMAYVAGRWIERDPDRLYGEGLATWALYIAGVVLVIEAIFVLDALSG